jgi:hypothetical protein
MPMHTLIKPFRYTNSIRRLIDKLVPREYSSTDQSAGKLIAHMDTGAVSINY